MKKLITTLMAVSIVLSPTLASAGNDVDKTEASLGKLRVAAKCDDKASVWRIWCSAAEYSRGKPGKLPKKTLVGLSIMLTFDGDSTKALSESVSLAAFAVDKSGQVKLTGIRPSSDDEKILMAEAVANLALYFKGKSPKAKLPKDLVGYLGSLKPAYPTVKGKTQWTWDGATPSSLRKVDKVWVVLEHPPEGIIATILTENWE